MNFDNHGHLDERPTPDWPPQGSAQEHPEGFEQHGSTGQLFRVTNRQWVRVDERKPIACNPNDPRPIWEQGLNP